VRIKTLCVFGTRPEAIKMAPVVSALNASPCMDNRVCVTGQHEQMLTSVLDFFQIKPDFNLSVMRHDQNLSELTARILLGLNDIFKQFSPDLILVHGDTTTCLTAALAAYYHRIPIAHVEAGLRTGDIYLPWPEEVNRKLTDVISLFHFAPTEGSRLNLLNEGYAADSIHVTGNTVIDALYYTVEQLEKDHALQMRMKDQFSFLGFSRRLILVTGHRRESFGDGFERICQALLLIAERHPTVNIVYPVHLNPNVQEPVRRLLGHVKNVHLIEPLDYLPFVYLMKASYFILTDSGGVQEEAPALGKPVLVMRDKTERPEAISAGSVSLVGTAVQSITEAADDLLNDGHLYQKMSLGVSPYGDGKAAERIVEIVEQHFGRDLRHSIKNSSESEWIS
jgi:UDP-N-acetylglucosamine 2-epimerase (non-hydrolysing)